MKSKSLIIGLVLALVIAGGIFLSCFLTSKEKRKLIKTRESISGVVYRGVQEAKKSNGQESINTFNEAGQLLKENSFELVLRDIKSFTSLINEFKSMQRKEFQELWDALSPKMQETIKGFSHSKNISEPFKIDFIMELNKVLSSKSFWSEEKINKYLEPGHRINQLIEWTNSSKTEALDSFMTQNRKVLYLNRLYAYRFWAPYFPMPLTEVELWSNIAISHFRNKDFDKAIEFSDRIIQVQDFYLKPYLLKARCFESKKDIYSAINVLKGLDEKMEVSGEVYSELGALYYKLNDLKNAKKSFEQALSVDPQSKSALIGQQILNRKGDNKLLSSSHYKNILKEKGDDAFIMSNYALALMKEKKYRESTASLEKALKAFPRDYYLHKLMGRLEGSERNYKKAVKHLIQAKKLMKTPDRDVYLLLGITYFNQFLTKEAYDILHLGLQEFPADPYITLHLGQVCEVIPENRKEALRWYESYLDTPGKVANRFRIKRKIAKIKKQLGLEKSDEK